MCSIHLITCHHQLLGDFWKRLNQSVDELPQTRIDQTKLMIDADDEHTNTKHEWLRRYLITNTFISLLLLPMLKQFVVVPCQNDMEASFNRGFYNQIEHTSTEGQVQSSKPQSQMSSKSNKTHHEFEILSNAFPKTHELPAVTAVTPFKTR